MESIVIILIFKVEDLREGLGIGDKYEKYGDLDRHVLTKALNTINSSNSFFSGKIKCKVTKRKRAPVEVQFSFIESDKPKISPRLQEAYKKTSNKGRLT
ncbi:RepB family plasmid replication initiator protein [Vibrio sinaloensis]|nr:RepB family plasmid replication initiator protein [Vibrio sinaloensis]